MKKKYENHHIVYYGEMENTTDKSKARKKSLFEISLFWGGDESTTTWTTTVLYKKIKIINQRTTLKKVKNSNNSTSFGKQQQTAKNWKTEFYFWQLVSLLTLIEFLIDWLFFFFAIIIGIIVWLHWNCVWSNPGYCWINTIIICHHQHSLFHSPL